MASKRPIIKQLSWPSLIPQFALIFSLLALVRFLGFQHHALIGVLIYFVIFFLLRFSIPVHHRKGITLFKKGRFEEAIQYFKNSYAFFKRNAWIDKYRYVVLLSSSHMSYTEMALLNIAYCYGQTGNGERSVAFYKQTLFEFPNSEMAKSSLRMYASAKNVDGSQGAEGLATE